MKKQHKTIVIIAGALTLGFAPAAFAGSQHAPTSQYPAPQYQGSQSYGHQNHAPVAAPYEPASYQQAAYEDEVIVYEERARRKQSFYFKPRDARSFKCRKKQGTQKCRFEFHGNNANDVEYYLAQALIFATGNTQNQAYCSHTRRADRVTCSVRGDLSAMDTGKLRYALYGR